MKKIVIGIIAIMALMVTACGSTQPEPQPEPATTQKQEIQETTTHANRGRQLSIEYMHKYPEATPENTKAMMQAIIDHWHTAYNCTNVDDVPEDFLVAASYFSWNFDIGTPEEEMGSYIWTAMEFLDDGMRPNFEECMQNAKSVFEETTGLTF